MMIAPRSIHQSALAERNLMAKTSDYITRSREREEVRRGGGIQKSEVRSRKSKSEVARRVPTQVPQILTSDF